MATFMKPRRIGLSRNGYTYASLHGDQLKQEPSVTRQPTPEDEDITRPRAGSSDEDVNRPPEGSSDEESDRSYSDFEGPLAKKRKRSGSGASEPSSMQGTLYNAPSYFRPSVFIPSRKLKLEEEDEDPFQNQPSQSKRPKNIYGRKPTKNIHAAKKTQRSPRASQNKIEFLKRDMSSTISKRTTAMTPSIEIFANLEAVPDDGKKFKDDSESQALPRSTVVTPESQRASRRSARFTSTSTGGEVPNNSEVPGKASSQNATPTKVKNQPKFKAPVVPEIVTPPKATPTFLQIRQPLTPMDANELGSGDVQDRVQGVINKSFQQAKVPASSTAESSLLSTSYDADSISSLSDPPDSPRLDGAQITSDETQATNAHEAQKHEPVPARCPVCKAVVDRAFLEEFNSGKPLRARQQTQFCKAHKVRTGEEEWMEKGYPKIDWGRIDKRLESFHPAVEDILLRRRTSFYRNVFEDRISKGQLKSLKAAMLDCTSMEEVIPGYYGSRGARAIIESITSKFASRIRRLAASDQVISTGGVPTYIQAVLAPELAVLLVMDDMKVDEEGARVFIRDSAAIGNLLNEEQDEVIHVIESDDELGM